uniref:hypothetical protein n=1 Tax=Prevotellamassilia timonensis TaxID=1852370 RepID=UPI004038B054
MKKITTLLLLCTVASSSALAQTKPVVNTGGEAYANAYVVASYNRGGSLAQSNADLKHNAQSAYTYWFLQNGSAEGSVKFINVRTGKGIATNFSVGDNAADLYVLANGVNDKGLSISNASTIKTNSCIDAQGNNACGQWAPNAGDWEGTTWLFTKAPGYFVSAAQGLVPVTTEQYHFDSKVITLPKATNKLRFRVLSTITIGDGGINDASGLYPFFTMGEFYLYDADGNKVTLTADNFKTNAQEASTTYGDNQNTVAHLCDGNKATCFHSTYSATPNTYHYIEVTLPTAMKSFKFSFDARNNKCNVPAMIQVLDDDAIAVADAEDQVLQARPSLVTLYNSTNYGLGTGYQQYTYDGDANVYTSARNVANDVLQKHAVNLTVDEVNTAKTNLENAAADASKFTINTPADGSYIRIRATNTAHTGMPYLTSDLSDVEGNTTRAALVSGANNAANSIFYYKDQKLIAYGTGYKATSNSNFLGYNGIADGTVVTFKAATESHGEYNVVYKASDGANLKLYAQVSNSKYYTDAYDVNKNHNRCRFWVEAVTSLPVSVSAAGYATLYAPVALTIPQNVQAYTASFADNNVTLTPIEGTIPANTGVVIEAAEGTYNFAITTTEATATSDLRGDVATANVDAASAAYILGKTDAQGVGFFKLNSTDREIKGGRAYYVAPNGGAAAYLFNGNVTGLEAIKTALNDANAPIYDLSGRKVAKAVKGGLYIKNGQKFIVK